MAVASIPIDWNLAQPAPNLDYTPSAMEGLDAAQKMRAAAALRNTDINDPASLSSGVANEVRAGQIEQASALAGLGVTRAQNAVKMNALGGHFFPGAQTQQSDPSSFGPQGAQGAAPDPTQPDQSSAIQAHQAAVINFEKQSADSLLAIPDPTLRHAQAGVIASQAQSMGIPPDLVQGKLSDLSDGALQQLSTTAGQWLQHPSFGGQGMQGPNPGLHDATQAHIQGAPNWLSNIDTINRMAALSSAGVATGDIQKGLEAGQGFAGAVSPGTTIEYGGNATSRTPYAPVLTGPGNVLKSQETGAPMGGQTPFEPQIATVHPAENVGSYNPNTGTFSGPAAASAPGQPQGAHDIYSAIGGEEGPGTNQRTGAANGVMAATAKQYGYDPARLSDPAYAAQARQGIIDKISAMPIVHGDPARIAVGFFSGTGNIAPVGSPTPWMHNTNDGHETVSSYVANVLGRMGVATPEGGGSGGVVAGGQGMTGGPMFSPPQTIPGLAGTRQVTATGQVGEPLAGSYADPTGFRQTVSTDQRVSGATQAVTTYQAMAQAAPTLDGPHAMALLDGITKEFTGGVARLGSVHALLDTFGIAQNVQGGLQKALEGKGPLTTQMRQQLLDAVYTRVQPLYGVANNYVQSQQKYIGSLNGTDAASASATSGLLPPMPLRTVISRDALPHNAAIGSRVMGPKGPLEWNGQAWVR